MFQVDNERMSEKWVDGIRNSERGGRPVLKRTVLHPIHYTVYNTGDLCARKGASRMRIARCTRNIHQY